MASHIEKYIKNHANNGNESDLKYNKKLHLIYSIN